MPYNIEKSGFSGRQYVGYGSGTTWRITGRSGRWIATADSATKTLCSRTVRGATLEAISYEIRTQG